MWTQYSQMEPSEEATTEMRTAAILSLSEVHNQSSMLEDSQRGHAPYAPQPVYSRGYEKNTKTITSKSPQV
jgi:hypothetical protein